MNYISYSGFKLYSQCPLAYWHSYVNKTRLPDKDNAVSSLFGSVVGRVFEEFYNDNLWKQKPIEEVVLSRVKPAYDFVVKDETARGRALIWYGQPGYVGKKAATEEERAARRWYKDEEEILADIRDAVARGVRIIKFYRLLGPGAAAEVKLNTKVKRYTFGGRADFILRRVKPHDDLVILDGKGSMHRDKYVDPKQLKWYALLYALRNQGALPDKLGFVYWRFDPPSSVDWVEFSRDDVDELLDEVLGAMVRIEEGSARTASSMAEVRRSFPARASDENCRFCGYVKMCPDGAAIRDEKTILPVVISGVGREAS